MEVEVSFPLELEVQERRQDHKQGSSSSGMSSSSSSSSSTARYQLLALSNHHGSTAGGHYTAHARVGQQWWELNDSRARLVREEQLQDDSVYMLFYERKI